LVLSNFSVASDPSQSAGSNRVYVIPDPTYPWAAAQIGSAIAGEVTYFEGTFLQAIAKAKADDVSGIVTISLDTSSLFESGRVDCFSATGKNLWHEKVSFNMGGGADEIAHKFADRLAKKVSGKHCSSP
jgi:hypothetical protein